MKNSFLQINALELDVFLGWPSEERSRRQVVKLDIHIQFPEAPKACASDDIKDTYCYRELIEGLRDTIKEKHFHLIEHLTQEVYNYFKSLLAEQSSVKVNLTKRPQIQGLGSVTFAYQDMN